jgi:hypothetical protein
LSSGWTQTCNRLMLYQLPRESLRCCSILYVSFKILLCFFITLSVPNYKSFWPFCYVFRYSTIDFSIYLDITCLDT